MTSACTEERFSKDTQNHSMDILQDDGLYRHLKFTHNGSSVYRFDLVTWPGHLCISGDYGTYVFSRIPDMFQFDLVTWPGHLCISGDCGTYVFSRIPDMFQFFRMRDDDFNKRKDGGLSINPGYWGEKLESISANGGYKEFDSDGFRERVREHYDEYIECAEPDKQEAADLWDEIETGVLIHEDDEYLAYHAAHEFNHNGFFFQDFFDGGGTERYTFRFIWCLYAIAWGIREYDLHHTKEAA